MYTARTSLKFAAAHFLADYHGKCENLHGHNYRVEIVVKGERLDAGGMLVDFSVMKSRLKSVLDGLDHRLLNDVSEFANNPSAERIAAFIFARLDSAFPALALAAVTVFESDDDGATFEREI